MALNQTVGAIEEGLEVDSMTVLLAPAVLIGRLRAVLDVLAGKRVDSTFRGFSTVGTTLDAMARGASQ